MPPTQAEIGPRAAVTSASKFKAAEALAEAESQGEALPGQGLGWGEL